MNTCAICLCVYNNERGLPAVLRNIDKIRESNIFDKIRILVYYDASKDASLRILHRYKKTVDSTIQIYNQPIPLNDLRTERIARARNGLLQMMKQGTDIPEYFIMMDSNAYSCVGEIRPNVLQQVLQRKDEWDAISFDREDGYYDHFALSYDPYIYSFFHFIDWSRAVERMRKDFGERLKQLHIDDLMPVFSAFNGFALYKTAVFERCTYSGKIDDSLFPNEMIEKHQQLVDSSIRHIKTGDCEHRHFHLEAIHKNNAKIRISPLSLFAKNTNKNTESNFGTKKSWKMNLHY